MNGNTNRTLYKHAEKFLALVDKFEKEQITADGKMVRSQDALKTLDNVLKKGLKFHNEVVEKELHKEFPVLNVILTRVEEYASKLQINEHNAKKLTLENSFIIWQQLEVALALLASYVMDFLHTEGN